MSKLLNLSKLVNVIDVSETSLIETTSLSDVNLEWVSEIEVFGNDNDLVQILMGTELIELGFIRGNSYKVKVFSNTPYPYRLFPILRIETRHPYKLKLRSTSFDSLISSTLYHVGAYYEINRNKFVLFKNGNIVFNNTRELPPECKLNSTWSDAEYVAVECLDFDKVAGAIDFAWIKDAIIPGFSTKYNMLALSELDVDVGAPAVLVSKAHVRDFIITLKRVYPKFTFEISKRLPSEIAKHCQDVTKKLIKYQFRKLVSV